MRRTKQESEQTRRHIIVAARRVFARRGVAHTTLEHIAAAAGVTRGAIYWHFSNKTELFEAMREQVALPLIDRTDFELLAATDDPLLGIERFLHSLITTVVGDAATRSTFQIMSLKCEYVDQFEGELRRQIEQCGKLAEKLTAVYERARIAGALRPELTPAVAALGTCVFVTGLLRLWLMDEDGAMIRSRALELISAHVASRRADPSRCTC